jgi:hypothetical protein
MFAILGLACHRHQCCAYPFDRIHTCTQPTVRASLCHDDQRHTPVRKRRNGPDEVASRKRTFTAILEELSESESAKAGTMLLDLEGRRVARRTNEPRAAVPPLQVCNYLVDALAKDMPPYSVPAMLRLPCGSSRHPAAGAPALLGTEHRIAGTPIRPLANKHKSPSYSCAAVRRANRRIRRNRRHQYSRHDTMSSPRIFPPLLLQ